MDGIKTTKSKQATRGESEGAEIVDAGPVLTEQLLRNGDEIFESEVTGKSYILNEKKRRKASVKSAKQDALKAHLMQIQNSRLEKDGTLKATNILKPESHQQQIKDKPQTAMLESQQTVITATARSHGLKATTHQTALHSLKDEKVQTKKENHQIEKAKSKHAKAEAKRREKEHSEPKLIK